MATGRARWLAREPVRILLLAVATALVGWLCWLLALPFLPALTWALVLAVLAHPIHRALLAHVRHESLAAALAVAAVVVLIGLPTAFVVTQIANQAAATLEGLRDGSAQRWWGDALDQFSILRTLMDWIDQHLDVRAQLEHLSEQVVTAARGVLSGSVYAVFSWLITLYLLFYFLRDRGAVLDALRRFLPLSRRESEKVFQRVNDTIYAIVFGSLAVGMVQGALAGLMFGLLGLPAPLVWAVVMAFLAMLPVLGTAIVWVPAVIGLAMSGHWGKALILLVWSGTLVALIDNLLYPVLVKSRLRLHTVPVFIAVVGGLLVFGAAGVVLGPVVLALAVALVDLWHQRLVQAEEDGGG